MGWFFSWHSDRDLVDSLTSSMRNEDYTSIFCGGRSSLTGIYPICAIMVRGTFGVEGQFG